MPMIIKNNVRYCSTGGDAESIVYNNAESGMEATNMQDAIDELNSNLEAQKPIYISLIPKLESNTSNGVVSSSSVYGDGYEAYRAFDEDLNTFWSSANGAVNPYIQYEFPNNTKKTVSSFSLQTRQDAASYMPTSVTFLYYNSDNDSWVETGIFTPTQNILEQTFTLSSAATSNRFRILINGTGNYAFAKISLYFETTESVNFYFDFKDGEYGYNTDPNRGADTFIPFKRLEIDSGSVLMNIPSNGKTGTAHVDFNRTFTKIPRVGSTNPNTYFPVQVINNITTTGFDIQCRNSGSWEYNVEWIAVVVD